MAAAAAADTRNSLKRLYSDLVGRFVPDCDKHAKPKEIAAVMQKIWDRDMDPRHWTLLDLKQGAHHGLKDRIIEEFKLADFASDGFLNRIDEIRSEILRAVSFADLAPFTEKSQKLLDYLLCMQIPLGEIPLRELDAVNLPLLHARFTLMVPSEKEKFKKKGAQTKIDMEKILDLPAASISYIPAKTIETLARCCNAQEEPEKVLLPPELFGLLTDEQVQELKFTDLSSRQIWYALKGTDRENETYQRRCETLSTDQLLEIAKKAPGLIPSSCLPKIDLGKLTPKQIENLYCSRHIKEERHQRRVATLENSVIALYGHQLAPSILKLLTEKQKAALPPKIRDSL